MDNEHDIAKTKENCREKDYDEQTNGDSKAGRLLNSNSKNGHIFNDGDSMNGKFCNGEPPNRQFLNGDAKNGDLINRNAHTTNGELIKYLIDQNVENVANGETIETPSYGDEVAGSEIQEFYKGKSILITGVTGFVGKVLLERLLATCPGVDKIYVIIREKRGQSASSRLEKFFQDPLFAYVDKKMRSKVNVVVGDISFTRVGLSNEDYQMLIDDVHIVIHCAANVRFDATMKELITTNVKGTCDLLDLSRKMKKLISFVYVSTIYSHHVNGTLEECFYDPGLDLDIALGLTTIESDDEDTLQIMHAKLLKSWPNMYSFSKGIAEHVVKLKGHGIPCCVFRPSIVSSTSYEHPLPGYLDNTNGSISYMLALGTGACRLIPGIPNKSMTLIPADYCANLIIACAWETAIKLNPDPLVYNYAPEDNLGWTVTQIVKYSAKHCQTEPFDNTFGYPMSFVAKNFFIFKIGMIILNVFPAILGDSIQWLMGHKPTYLKLCRKLYKMCSLGYKFSSDLFIFNTSNYRRLHASMSPVDQKLFNINLDDYSVERNFSVVMRGIKHYILKEDLQVSNKALRKLKRHKIYFYSSVCLSAILVFYLIFYFITKIFN